MSEKELPWRELVSSGIEGSVPRSEIRAAYLKIKLEREAREREAARKSPAAKKPARRKAAKRK